MNSFKERCVVLRKQDKSITEIAAITGRAKSSIYPHIRGIPLSPARLKRYRLEATSRIRRYPLARKGKSVRPFRTFVSWSPQTVRLVSHLMFDGELAHGGCIYNNRSGTLIGRVKRLMRVLYDFEPKHWTNPLTGVNRISYYNVALSTYLRGKAERLVRDIRELPTPCKRAFLQAFFDDEGCMDFRPASGHRKARGYQKNTKLLKLVRDLLGDFGIDARIVPPNEVQIVGKDNLSRFEKEINFSSGVRMNGHRTNSRWKKHIEKRQLLRAAIRSFHSSVST